MLEEFGKSQELINSNSPERMQEIEQYIQDYFKKYKVGYEKSGEGSTQGTKMAESFWKGLKNYSNEKMRKVLEEKLIGKTLVDLGSGADGRNRPAYNNLLPFKKYLAVDIDKPYANAEYAVEDMIKQGVDASNITEDMLRYVANLPDKSSNFFLSAIDNDVVLDDKYWQYLAEEIYRVTEDHGIVIDGGMTGLNRLLDKKKFKIIYQGEGFGNSDKRVFEKIT